ncbi:MULTISPECIES: ASKHA domain-containing protein [Aerococcus]|uniref:DUF4445 domain-containing protein n=1 Tax=Aerococcus sanguinicola TaxID=119206 RepID=A0A5N1GIZ8_9LACT|nr:MULTISPECIES: ASKHA domain-containing protein [Aerococcus]KAA9300288.1 DUF4445 domain-containing protein [Aerococcus sanguinicola]MDK6370149.1 ASKHA domain-containing protein [Aerococcus sp. UMB9870]MDK6680637.1 ASKHA domain-containing protein [Aerococcus sp. UMB8608]MDK6687575.1 ASKHA domain-containing protein [Aerococcus sp. UMB8623]MDK6940587.1 ASKHA domain-containing protein [Aerococcus sp. UMB8487]
MKIQVQGFDQVIDYDPSSGQTLYDCLVDAGLPVPGDCGGQGTCGKCRFKCLAGEVSLDSYQGSQDASFPLACQARPQTDLSLAFLNLEKGHRILVSGDRPALHGPKRWRQATVSLERKRLEEARDLDSSLAEELGVDPFPAQVWRGLPIQRQQSYRAVICDKQLLALEVQPEDPSIYGLAVDIGTTTLAASLVNLETGEEVSQATALNPQIQQGADVLSRISYVMKEGERGLKRLQQAIRRAIQDLIEDLSQAAACQAKSIYGLSLAGNTVMTHLALGIDPSLLGQSPYLPIFRSGQKLSAQAFGLRKLPPSAQVMTLPAVSAYIGSDVVAGAYAAGLSQKGGRRLLIDIGTNGEMVLQDGEAYVSCSCAAGPALEGMMISSGMKAANGAIEECQWKEGQFELQVIGEGPAQGICGSGVLAIIREALRAELINYRGRIVDPDALAPDDCRRPYLKVDTQGKRYLAITDQIRLTQHDIRQVQLAKGAIRSGIEVLLEASQLEPQEVDQVLVAGQFGRHLAEASLLATGLLPQAFAGRLSYIGNSSHSGAYLHLMDRQAAQGLEDLAHAIDYIELSRLDNYDRVFARASLFPRIKRK